MGLDMLYVSAIFFRSFIVVVLLVWSPSAYALQCDPCIERTDYTVRAIIHGFQSSTYWSQVQSSMKQAANDMRINLQCSLYQEFDPDQMVKDILATIPSSSTSHMDALIVSIPTLAVKEAVEQVIAAGIPVFGINSGYDYQLKGIQNYVSMDEKLAGREAARAFLVNTNSINGTNQSKRYLFLNQESSNTALDLRRQGFNETLQLETTNMDAAATPIVEELKIDPAQATNVQQVLNQQLEGCPYDGILLAGTLLLDQVTAAYYANECSFSTQRLGTFDTNAAVYDAIAIGKLQFAIAQQQYLQGAFTVVLAALYVTTEQNLAPSASTKSGTYLSGPQVITLATLPTDTQQACESEAFPICGGSSSDSTTTTMGGRCGCADRNVVRIGGVLPDPDLPFWQEVWAAAQTAANDMGVQLLLDPIERPDELETENIKTAEKVKSLCSEGVDGLFTTIKSVEVFEAIQFCQSLNVPVVSLNSGANYSQQLGLMQHISQIEYAAGYGGGEKLVAAGTQRGFCINYHISNDLSPRCDGFRDALGAANVTFENVIAPPHDNYLLFLNQVEQNITSTDDSWEGIGILLASRAFVESTVRLKVEHHEKVLIGTFDLNDAVYQGLDDNLIEFGIDQQPYLQGYLPIPILTWFAHTKQSLQTRFLETGPAFVEKSPDIDQTVCEANFFEVCPEPFNRNQLEKVRPVGLTFAGIIYATALAFTIWVLANWSHRIVKASQPIFLCTICAGTCVMASAIFPLSLDDGMLRDDGGCVGCECQGCNTACMAAPWLISIGFTLIFASLFSKIWRVNRLVGSSARFRRLQVSVKDVMIPFAVLLLLNLTFMLIWTLIDPMYWIRERRCGSDDFTSYGLCIVGRDWTSVAMAVAVLLTDFCAVALATYQAYKARNISTEFSESTYIGLAMASILQVMLIGVPLLILVKDNPSAMFFVQCGIITVVCMSVLLLIFVPKIRLFIRQRKGASASLVLNSNSAYSATQSRLNVRGRIRRSIGLRVRRGLQDSSTPSCSREQARSKGGKDEVTSTVDHDAAVPHVIPRPRSSNVLLPLSAERGDHSK